MPRFLLAIIAVLLSFAAVQATAYPLIFNAKAFPEGDARNNAIGGSYWFADGRWNMEIHLGIWGASGLAQITREQVNDIQGWQTRLGQDFIINWSMFENGQARAQAGALPSFDDYPEIKAQIERQIQAIERELNTPFLRTKITYFFVDPNLLKRASSGTEATGLVHGELRDAASTTPFIPVLFDPTPMRDIIPPGAWDPYANPEFNAHELFHLISLDHFNDGYLYVDYPLNGVMNGGEEFRELRRLGVLPSLQTVELNTLLYNQAKARGEASANDLRHSQWAPNYYTKSPMTAENYMEEDQSQFWQPFAEIPVGASKDAAHARKIEVYRQEMAEKVKLFQKSCENALQTNPLSKHKWTIFAGPLSTIEYRPLIKTRIHLTATKGRPLGTILAFQQAWRPRWGHDGKERKRPLGFPATSSRSSICEGSVR